MEPSELAEVLARGEELLLEQHWLQLRDLVRNFSDELLYTEPDLLFFLAISEFECGAVGESIRRTRELIHLTARFPRSRVCRRAKHMEAICAITTGDLNVAEAALLKQVNLSQEAGDEKYKALAEANLAVVYEIRCKHHEAILRNQAAISYWVRRSRWATVGGSYHNMGMSYRQLGMYKSAEACFKTAQRFENLADATGVNAIQGSEIELALLYCLRGDVDLAQTTIQHTLSKPSLKEYEVTRAEALRVQGIIFAHANRRGDSMDCLREALRLARKNGIKMLRAELHEEFAVHFEDSGTPRSARHRRAAARLYRIMGAESRATMAETHRQMNAIAS
jgi:tetratricopeptide (TPR) repeat protein